MQVLCALLCLATSIAASAAATCSVAATGPAFGNYDPLSASPTLANGSVVVTCTWITGSGTAATTVNLLSSYTAGNSGSYASRYMLSGLNRLNYNLYFDPAFTQIRGDGTGGSLQGSASLIVSSTIRTASATGILYGRIPAAQNGIPGSYTDSITVTINY
jgi:spore coat protein U-like protein